MKNPSIKRSVVWRSLFACLLTTCALPALAQSVVVTPYTLNYWVGINTSNVLGVGSNLVTTVGGPAVSLAVTGPSGVTPVLSTISSTTASTNLGIVLACTNATTGANVLTISASGGASYSTNVNLFVVPQWAQTNGSSFGLWSDSTKWSGGAVPGTSDSAYFESTIDVPYTNIVDSSRTVQSLIYIADQGSAGADIVTVINSGSTLSVLGTNGLYFGIKQSVAKRPGFFFSGAGALVVNNNAANVAANSGSGSSSGNGPTINMTNLNTFAATVNRFGAGDGALNYAGLFGGELVNFYLAKTNTIVTSYTDDYTALSFDCAFQFQCNKNYSSGSSNPFFYLGLTNGIYTDSIGIGRAKGTGSVSINGGGSTLRFAPTASNSIAPFSSAVFRGSLGGNNRVKLVAVGVDSGAAGTAVDNTIGTMDLRGGVVDMLADQIWLGHNRTNALAGKTAAGCLMFDWGTINANNVKLGYMQYTNGAFVAGYMSVGSNATLIVNNTLEMGHTPADNTGFPSALAASTGQLMITNGGTVRANQITFGQFSATNIVTVASSSSLIVTNGIGSAANGLTTLNLDGAKLTFFVSTGFTNAYVTNLNTTTTASKINIASAPAGQSTNVLIVFQATNQLPNISIGSLPPGFNNMQIVIDGLAKTVSLVISTNQPKNLVWRGGANAQWDHTSLNWQDTNTLAITKFTDGDQAIFDDKSGVPTTISIVDTVNPGQSGNGIVVNNTTNRFTFANGGGSIGSCTLAKAGTNSLEIDCSAGAGAQLNGGILNIYSGGSIANATTLAGTTLNIDSSSAVSGGVTCAGNLQAAGTISGSLSLQTSANAANSGTVSGPVSMQSGTTLNNSGIMTAIGSLTVATNSTLVNAGTIYGSTLTVNVGGTLIDTVPGSAANSSGSINVATLLVNGTFYPGGTGRAIATTKVTDYDYSTGSGDGNPNGRVQLSAGSLTVIKVNSTNVQPYTKILSFSQVFGPSGAVKAINGCTLLISNIGPTVFSAGDSLKLFGNYINDTVIGNAGLNTTNSYPVIIPTVPGPGLTWDMTQLYASGTIGVIAASSVQITLTNTVTLIGGTNIVTELSWPPDFIGTGWLQQQIGTLTNGLGTNWSNVGQSDYVNDIFLTNTVTGGSTIYYRFVRP